MLKKIYMLTAFRALFLFLIKEAEKSASSRWKRFLSSLKTIIYSLMVIRILLAIYFRVHDQSES